jgi:hypothetical protein
MPRIIVTTARRHTQPDEPSGFIYLIDLEARRIITRSQMIEPPYRAQETNPRGGMRGSKGITIRPDRIAIANSAAVFQYDPNWKLLGVCTHPSCSAIHDIAYHEDTLWATSARNDLLAQFDLDGRLLKHYYLREPSPALKQIAWKPPLLLTAEQIREGRVDFRNPRTHDELTFDRAHLNSLCFLSNGDMLVSLGQVANADLAASLRLKVFLMRLGLWPLVLDFNRRLSRRLNRKKDLHSDLVIRPATAQSAVVRLSPDGAHVLCLALPGVSTPSHSLLALPDDSVVYLNTHAGSIVHFDPFSGAVHSATKVTDGFLRGATRLDENKLLLGSKGELITFDLPTRQAAGVFKFTADPNESVYDVKVLPAHFAAPPASFEENFVGAMKQSTAEFLRCSGSVPALVRG